MTKIYNKMRKNKLYHVQNGFSLIKKTGKMQYHFSSSLAYSTLPKNQLIFTGVKNVIGDFFQTSTGNTFSTGNSLSFSHDLGKLSKLALSFSFSGAFDNIQTHLQKNDTAFVNHNSGYKLVSSVSPSLILSRKATLSWRILLLLV